MGRECGRFGDLSTGIKMCMYCVCVLIFVPFVLLVDTLRNLALLGNEEEGEGWDEVAGGFA